MDPISRDVPSDRLQVLGPGLSAVLLLLVGSRFSPRFKAYKEWSYHVAPGVPVTAMLILGPTVKHAESLLLVEAVMLIHTAP